MGAEVGVMWSQPRTADHQQPGQRHAVDSPSEPQEGTNCADTLLQTSACRTVFEHIAVILGHQDCSHVFTAALGNGHSPLHRGGNWSSQRLSPDQSHSGQVPRSVSAGGCFAPEPLRLGSGTAAWLPCSVVICVRAPQHGSLWVRSPKGRQGGPGA